MSSASFFPPQASSRRREETMPSIPLLAMTEGKPSPEEAPASEEMPPANLTPFVVKDPSAEEKESLEMTPHPEEEMPFVVKDPSAEEKEPEEEMPFLDEVGEASLVAKSFAAAIAKKLSEGVTPSANEQLAGAAPSAEERSAEETKSPCAKPATRIGRPFSFLGVPDPNGAVRFMAVISLLYLLVAPFLLQSVASQPTELVWTASHLVSSYFFIGTICFSKMPFCTIFFRVSYGELLSVAATHFIGNHSGTTVATLLTFFSAGLFGHAMAEYLQSQEEEELANVLLTPSSQVKLHEESIYYFLFMHSVMSFFVIMRMVSLVLCPASVLLLIAIKDGVKVPLFIVEEISLEILFLAWPWSGFVALILQEETAICLSTMMYRIPAGVVAFYTLSCVLSFAVGQVAALLALWLIAMAMAGLLGYILAMFTRYRRSQRGINVRVDQKSGAKGFDELN